MTTREAMNMQEVGSISEMYINATADRYGNNSMELAEVLLELALKIILRPTTAPGKDSVPASLVTYDGHTFVATPLTAYLFQTPESIEARLSRVESVLLSALPTWATIDLQKFEIAAAALIYFGMYYGVLGKNDHFEQLILTVLSLSKEHLGPTHPFTVDTLSDLGTAYQRHGKVEESREVLEETLALCESDPAIMAFSGPRVLYDCAQNAITLQKLDAAEGHLRLAMEILEKAPVVNKRMVLSVLCKQAEVFHLMGNRQEFDPVATEAQQVADEIWPSEPEFVAEMMSVLAHLCEVIGAKPEAERILLKLIRDIEILASSENSRTTVEGLMRLGSRIVGGANSHQSDGDPAS